MSGVTNLREWRRRCGAAVTLALLLSWAVAPALHAQFEVAGASSAIEQGHSDDCPRIHAETFCLTCGGIQLPAPSCADRVPQLDTGSILPSATCERIARPATSARDGHAVRAPPLT